MKVIRDNTHKKNIIENIFNKIGLPSNYTTKIIDDIVVILISGIIKKKIIKIKNFGTFSLRKKNKRIGRNPKSKKEYEITERNVVVFKAVEIIKKKLNNNVRT
jgi:integration host factor subunit alpha